MQTTMAKIPNPIDRHVGNRVRMQRILMNMSQEKLGDALGITFQQVQKYEKGVNRISASRLQQISQTLQVPPSFFFQGTSGKNGAETVATTDPGVSVTEFLSTAEGIQLNRAFARIPDPKVRRKIIDLVIALGDQPDKEGSVGIKA
jgi:transcriptional regulator with XRE-family HTH domain